MAILRVVETGVAQLLHDCQYIIILCDEAGTILLHLFHHPPLAAQTFPS